MGYENDGKYPEFKDREGYAGRALGDEAFMATIIVLTVWAMTAVGFLDGGWLFWAIVVCGGWIVWRLLTIWPKGVRWRRRVLNSTQAQRLRARFSALGKWFSLAAGARRKDGDIAQLMSVSKHLADTPFNPFRLVFWTTLIISVASVVWGSAAWFVRVPALERERDVAREDLAKAVEANGKWRDAFEAQKRDALAARAALAQTSLDSARSLAAAGKRSAENERIRRRSAQRQKEILDAGRANPDAQPFDGGEWLQRRLAAESDRGAGADAGPAASTAAPVAAGVLPVREPAAPGDDDRAGE